MEKKPQNRDMEKKKNFFKKNFTKFFLMIFVSLSFFVIGVNAADNASTNEQNISSSDWGSANFKIQLSDYDPIKHTAKGSDQTGEATGGNDWKGIIQRLLEKLSNLMLMIIPILGAVALIIAGYFYIFSFSDEENVTKAKTIIKYNLLAMVVAFGSWAIISTIASFF